MNSNYLLSALILTLIIPVWGILIYLFNQLIYTIIAKLASERVAMLIVNWLTFPGVIHHEVSHALLAEITGAIVTEFRPFWPDQETGSLGHVNFTTQGSVFMRCIQYTLTSTAPVILGTISALLLFALTQKVSLPVYLVVLIAYLIFSIIIHASMSFADVKIMIRGIWVLYIIFYVFCLCTQIDIISRIQFLITR